MVGLAFDYRWAGDNGIGRFAREIQHRLQCELTLKNGGPARAFSPLEIDAFLHSSGATSFFSPGYVPPLLSKVPFIFSIHDLNHIKSGHNASLAKSIFYKIIVKPAVERSHRVLTVSEFSKSEIINWTNCRPEKICVVGNGISETFKTYEDPLLNIAPITSPYFFCCSNRKSHKNEKRLIDAFYLSGLASDFRLVFTGIPDIALEKHIHRRKLSTSVLFTGALTEQTLASYYKGALATVFPSLYEGFGLPLLESMACGTPVIASNTSSLPEIGGDAALYVDPESPESIAHAMSSLAADQYLRKSLQKKGFSRAQLFSWEKTVSLVRDALEGL